MRLDSGDCGDMMSATTGNPKVYNICAHRLALLWSTSCRSKASATPDAWRVEDPFSRLLIASQGRSKAEVVKHVRFCTQIRSRSLKLLPNPANDLTAFGKQMDLYAEDISLHCGVHRLIRA